MSLPVDKPSYGNLDGLKVVYSAVEIAVPTACEIMSEWGADITWIENTYSGDSVRDTEFVKEMERRNQRSISMNPFTDEGKEIIRALVKDADIFIESSKGPVWARRGASEVVPLKGGQGDRCTSARLGPTCSRLYIQPLSPNVPSGPGTPPEA